MRVGRLLAAAALLVTAGCAATPDDAEDGDVLGEPPTVVVAGDGTELALQAWAWCWTDATSGGCADGAPPDHPASIGSPDAVEITFPHEGWWFRATLVESTTDDCPRHILTNLSRETATTHRLEPVGPAGTWTVELVGDGPEGDLVVTFLWDTPVDGPVPAEQTGGCG